MNSIPPADQAQRDRFISDLSTNFSVQASAGAGKTTAIIDRIVSFALNPEFQAKMKQLIVVTYTVKAAEELRQRARLNILDQVASQKAGLEDVNRINQAFFGTIHSFCVMLMQRFGFLVGLSVSESELGSVETFWSGFLSDLHRVKSMIEPGKRKTLYRVSDFDTVAELAVKCAKANIDWAEYLKKYPLTEAIPSFPQLDRNCLDTFDHSNARSLETINKRRSVWCEFCLQWNDSDIPFVQVPKPGKTGGGAEFFEAYQKALSLPNETKERATLVLAMEMAAQFEQWRWDNGKLTFQDQINGALRIFQDIEAARVVRNEGYSILLDEAQDTDPRQFELLIQSVRPVEAPIDSLLVCAEGFPGGGRFCMVGDMQQLIYSQRSSLDTYRRYHGLLTDASRSGAELKFTVTFRCGKAVIDFVNEAFVRILDGKDGQASFTPLEPKDGASQAQVYCHGLVADEVLPEKITTEVLGLYEARKIAAWIKESGIKRLRARSWSEVALLLPRNNWFSAFAQAFEEIGMSCQLASGREKWVLQPALRWSVALLKWVLRPDDEYELAGILREVFAISDEEIYLQIKKGGGKGSLLDRGEEGGGSLSEAVRKLLRIRQEIQNEAPATLFEKLSEGVQLAQRLAVLPSGRAQVDHWKKIRLSANEAAAQGMGLEEFIDQLMNPSDERVAEEEKNKEAIQLYSMHMSKGLEWDAVVMPLLGRGVGQRNNIYPEIQASVSGPVRLISRESGVDSGSDPDTRFRKELERLTYVALTRARNTLVLVDDSALVKLLKQNQGVSITDILTGRIS